VNGLTRDRHLATWDPGQQRYVMPRRITQVGAQGGRSAITYATRDLSDVEAEQAEQAKQKKGGWSAVYGWIPDRPLPPIPTPYNKKAN
jgi:hypothetical protein